MAEETLTEHILFNHTPVLLKELTSHIPQKGEKLRAIDATTGGGGHAGVVCRELMPGSQFFLCDQDQDAIRHLGLKFQSEIESKKVNLVHCNFSNLKNYFTESQIPSGFDYIYADLGVSSHQLDTKDRGFSFRFDAELDMRMDQRAGLSAKDIVNTLEVRELLKILRDLGEEKLAPRIAHSIVQAREKSEIKTTQQLASIIEDCYPAKLKAQMKIHPATKAFQAIRMYVNDELGCLQRFLADALDLLRPGGRLAIISFHSLEDRMVKQFFKTKCSEHDPLKHLRLPQFAEIPAPLYELIKPFPIMPSDQEIEENPRSRSARLRILEKC